MKHTVLLLLCFIPLVSLAQKPADSSAEIITLENAWVQAEVHNDADALDKLLADTFVSTQPDGSSQNKAETLAYVRDKGNHWDTCLLYTSDAADE